MFAEQLFFIYCWDCFIDAMTRSCHVENISAFTLATTDQSSVGQQTAKGTESRTSSSFFFNKAIFVWPSNENARKNRNNKRNEIERFDWFIKRIQTCVAFGWLNKRSGENISWLGTFLKSIDTSLWRKTKSPCSDLFIHWLIKQITNTYQNHFSRS